MDTEGLLRISGAATRVKVFPSTVAPENTFIIYMKIIPSPAKLTQVVCLCSMQSLCQELESSFYDGTFPWKQLKQHDAASLLKLFIRELPHPLLTVEYLNAFIAVNSVYMSFLHTIMFDIR